MPGVQKSLIGTSRSMQLSTYRSDENNNEETVTKLLFADDGKDNIRAPYRQTEYYFDYKYNNTDAESYFVMPNFYNSQQSKMDVYGEYLSFNNPHKTSLFLASGIPVIIWEKAALADFVRENHCGITVSSLDEIRQAVDSMTDEEYDGLCRRAEQIGRLLRSGTMTRAAADAILTRW